DRHARGEGLRPVGGAASTPPPRPSATRPVRGLVRRRQAESMNATRRHAGEAGGRTSSDAAVRGALLIGVAIVIGLLLLWRAHDDDSSSVATTGDGAEVS